MIANKEAGAKSPMALKRMLCIWYLISFQEGKLIIVLIDSSSKVNLMTPTYVIKLGFTTQKTSVRALKIDGSSLGTYSIVTIGFLLQDSQKRVQFFEKVFLLANTNIEVILGILFLVFSNANFYFDIKKLT